MVEAALAGGIGIAEIIAAGCAGVVAGDDGSACPTSRLIWYRGAGGWPTRRAPKAGLPCAGGAKHPPAWAKRRTTVDRDDSLWVSAPFDGLAGFRPG